MQLPSYCRGCGAPLQTTDSKSPGFVPQEALDRTDLRCQRCYRIRHYGQREEVGATWDDYFASVRRGIAQADSVVQVVDIVDYEGSWSPALQGLIGQKPWIVAVNKVDLLPKTVSSLQVVAWVTDRLEAENRRPVAVVPVSSTKGWGLTKLIDAMQKFSSVNRTVVMVGATNVGKSSLLNGLARPKYVGDKKLGGITTSSYPGTTLNLIRLDLGKAGLLVIDTPGLPQEGRVSDSLCPQCGQVLIPAGELARKTFKLEAGQSLLLGGLVQMAFTGGAPRPIVVAFAARTVRFHTTKTERAAQIIQRHSGTWLLPPCDQCTVTDWVETALLLEQGQDLVVPGLGWVSVRRGPVELIVKVPRGVTVVTRPALIAPEQEGRT